MSGNVRRTKSGQIQLALGQTEQRLLPPISAGAISVKAWYFKLPGGLISDKNKLQRRLGPLARRRLDDVLTGDGWGGLDDPGFATKLATNVKLELICGDKVIAEGLGSLLVKENSIVGASWEIRATRLPRPSFETQGSDEYQIELNYPTAMTVQERAVPIAALNNAFDKNWNNGHQYLTNLDIKDGKLTYKIDTQFADIYGLSDGEIDLGIPGRLNIPDILLNSITMHSGVDEIHRFPDNTLPGEAKKHFAYICAELKFDVSAPYKIELDAYIGDKDLLDLPKQINFKFKLYFETLGSTNDDLKSTGIGYFSNITGNLLDFLHRITFKDFSWSDGFETRNLGEIITRNIEEAVNDWQWTGIRSPKNNKFSKIVHSWLVGNYAAYYVRGSKGLSGRDHRQQKMLVGWVQPVRPKKRDIILSEEPSGGTAPQSSIEPLFPFSKDEVPDPLPEGGPFEGPTTPIPAYITNPGSLSAIKNYVVLMQENRSFDQVFGYLQRDKGRMDVEGLRPGDNERDSVSHDGVTYRSRRITDTAWPSFKLAGPGHHHENVVAQMASAPGRGRMTGFMADFASRLHGTEFDHDGNFDILSRIYDYYTDKELPTYAALSDEFAICDHWFCAHIGPTWPNRFVTFAGDLNRNQEGKIEIDNPELSPFYASEMETIFDVLERSGISWKVYEHGYCFLRLYRKYTFDNSRIVAFDDPVKGFAADAKNGKLPQFAFVEPDYIDLPDGNDDHPPADMAHGQKLVASIALSMLDGPQWNDSMLIVTYDEHGGFYDHVLPPEEIVEVRPDGTERRRPIGMLANGERQLGPRVPALVVSPRVGKGIVSHDIFDHTAIAATIMRGFLSPRPPEISKRVRSMNDLRNLVSETVPRPLSEFDSLKSRLQKVLEMEIPKATPDFEILPPPLRKFELKPRSDDFHGLIAAASSFTGRS